MFFILISTSAEAQTELGDEAFRQAIRDIGTDLRLMCVAAHPDDEDGATLAMYRKAYGLKTFAIIATRGEGGQNEIGPELGKELGLIRTKEMIAAAAVTGAELHFLDLPEFGFSKSIEETYATWGKNETLRRMVSMIRECRPDVIITHHGRLKDHGHHQAIGETLLAAFDAAADPSVFPEQLAEGLTAWQAARLYIRAWQPSDSSIWVNIAELDALRGKTYAEIAAQALDQHRSQGMGFFKEKYLTGRPKVGYDLVRTADSATAVKGAVHAPDGALLAGLFDRVSKRERALSKSTEDKSQLLPVLLKRASESYAKKTTSPEAYRSWQRINQAAVLAGDMKLAPRLEDAELVPGQQTSLSLKFVDFASREAENVQFALMPSPNFVFDTPESAPISLSDQQEADQSFAVSISETESVTVPKAEYLFDKTTLTPQLIARAVVKTGVATLELEAPIRFEVAPKTSITPAESVYLFRRGHGETVNVVLVATNHGNDAAEAEVVLTAHKALAIEQEKTKVLFTRGGEQRTLSIAMRFHSPPDPGDYHVAATIEGATSTVDVVIRVADVEVPQEVMIGVVQSYDDTFIETLERLGIPHKALTWSDFSAKNVSPYTTIIVDIRAYMVRSDLVANNSALLEYVENGGHLIVMYQKTFEWNERFAPYPIHLSTNRVTQEDAPIMVLKPDHPMFHSPNTITALDWAYWVHERGLYFPDAWDEHYTALIGCSDAGESIPPGGILVAQCGKGTYVYTALVWYRQLKELHPGALRLFANMIALP